MDLIDFIFISKTPFTTPSSESSVFQTLDSCPGQKSNKAWVTLPGSGKGDGTTHASDLFCVVQGPALEDRVKFSEAPLCLQLGPLQFLRPQSQPLSNTRAEDVSPLSSPRTLSWPFPAAAKG